MSPEKFPAASPGTGPEPLPQPAESTDATQGVRMPGSKAAEIMQNMANFQAQFPSELPDSSVPTSPDSPSVAVYADKNGNPITSDQYMDDLVWGLRGPEQSQVGVDLSESEPYEPSDWGWSYDDHPESDIDLASARGAVEDSFAPPVKRGRHARPDTNEPEVTDHYAGTPTDATDAPEITAASALEADLPEPARIASVHPIRKGIIGDSGSTQEDTLKTPEALSGSKATADEEDSGVKAEVLGFKSFIDLCVENSNGLLSGTQDLNAISAESIATLSQVIKFDKGKDRPYISAPDGSEIPVRQDYAEAVIKVASARARDIQYILAQKRYAETLGQVETRQSAEPTLWSVSLLAEHPRVLGMPDQKELDRLVDSYSLADLRDALTKVKQIDKNNGDAELERIRAVNRNKREPSTVDENESLKILPDASAVKIILDAFSVLRLRYTKENKKGEYVMPLGMELYDVDKLRQKIGEIQSQSIEEQEKNNLIQRAKKEAYTEGQARAKQLIEVARILRDPYYSSADKWASRVQPNTISPLSFSGVSRSVVVDPSIMPTDGSNSESRVKKLLAWKRKNQNS